jgi:hypothetical protein
LILDKMEQEEGSKSKFWLADKQRELLSFMPREIKVMHKENDPESATLSWEVNEADRRLNGFEVTLSWGEAFTKKYLHDEGKEDNVGQESATLRDTAGHGDARTLSVEGSARTLSLDNLVTGREYIVYIRHKAKQAFYSVPFTFTPPVIEKSGQINRACNVNDGGPSENSDISADQVMQYDPSYVPI